MEPEVQSALETAAKWMRWWLAQETCECDAVHTCGWTKRMGELESIDAVIAQHSAAPVDWPPEPGWYAMEYVLDGITLTDLVYAMQDERAPQILVIAVGRSLWEPGAAHLLARFLPANVPTFPPREAA